MKVAIIGAMQEEISLLKDKLLSATVFQHAHSVIYTGKLHGIDIALVKSGIGKIAAALSTTLLLEREQPDIVINTGSAGGLDLTLNIGDIVISTATCYHDVDLTAFGYVYGQMAACPASFSADNKLIALTEQAVEQCCVHAVKGLICSGDSFINGGDRLQHIKTSFPTAIAVEMEAAAIAHVCHLYNVPFVVIRAISDVADKQSHCSFDEFLTSAAEISSTIVERLIKLIK